MIIGRAANTELMRTGTCSVTVEKNPPDPGDEFWVRPSAMSEPSSRAWVADRWEIKHGDEAGATEVLLKRIREGRAPRRKAERPAFRLTKAQRSRVFAGDAAPLLFEDEPPCAKGDKVFLSWTRPKRVFDEKTKRVTDPPREPLVWIVITGKARRPASEGGWEVRFKIEDRRPLRTRLIRRTPPTLDQDTMRRDLDRAERTRRDLHRSLTDDEKAEAREESSYTTSPRDAVDQLEGVADHVLDQFVEEAERGKAQTATLQQGRRERHALELRLARLRRDAAIRGVDISSPERVIERQIRKMEKRVYEGKIENEEAA